MSFIVLDAVRAAKEVVLAKLADMQGKAGKPLRITVYTNGAGVHNILPESTHQIINLIGAGGNGLEGGIDSNYAPQIGIQGGAGWELYRRVSLQGAVAYEVGASGGGGTRLGVYKAPGGGISMSSPTPQGVTMGEGGSYGAGGRGGDSPRGRGGENANGVVAAKPATGYGAGGGAGIGPKGGYYVQGNWRETPPSSGTGGFICIEEY